MDSVNLDTTLNASELSEARAYFQKIQFAQERNEFERFETMVYEGNLTIYRQVSVKLLQSFRVLSKSIISQVRNFSTTPQNLARVFVRLSGLLSAPTAAPIEPPTTIERVTMYSDFLKVFIYKASLESKKDESPIFEKILELTLDLILYGGFEGNFTATAIDRPFTAATPYATNPSSLASSVVATPAASSSSLCRDSSVKGNLGLTLLSPDDIDVSGAMFESPPGAGSGGLNGKKNGSNMFISPDDL